MNTAIATETRSDLVDDLTDALPLVDGIKAWIPLSSGGRPKHPLTVKRWIADGVGPQKVKLRAIRIGGALYLTRRDVEAFFAALNDATNIEATKE